MRTRSLPLLGIAAAVLSAAAPAHGQGAGSAGAQVLQIPAGSRAAAFSGAYSAARGDADVIFYNPAGLAGLDAAAGFSLQRYAHDVTLGSAAGALRVGPLVLGIGAAFLDAGEIEVLEPDPLFGGQRGTPTGVMLQARESAANLAAALPLAGGRLRLGAAAALVASDLAGASGTAPAFDLGAQLDLRGVTAGAALRTVGGSIGGGTTPAPLPTEARFGIQGGHAPPGALGARAAAEVIARLREGTAGLVGGVEAGLLPDAADRFGAVLRLGYDAGQREDGFAGLHLGGGLSLAGLAFDYTYRNLAVTGAVHRLGVRWKRLP
jgi:hypothetical protein